MWSIPARSFAVRAFVSNWTGRNFLNDTPRLLLLRFSSTFYSMGPGKKVDNSTPKQATLSLRKQIKSQCKRSLTELSLQLTTPCGNRKQPKIVRLFCLHCWRRKRKGSKGFIIPDEMSLSPAFLRREKKNGHYHLEPRVTRRFFSVSGAHSIIIFIPISRCKTGAGSLRSTLEGAVKCYSLL